MLAFDKNEGEFKRRLEEEKLASLQAFAYGASHEINNPLANISMRAQTLLASESDPKKRELLFAIYRQALRAHAMLADMMTYARPPQPKLTEVDLVQLAQSAIKEAQEAARSQNTRLTLRVPQHSVAVKVDFNHILLAIRAVIDNSLESLLKDGAIEVELLARRASEGEEAPPQDSNHYTAEISIRDNGPGMTEEVHRHCLDPFFSGREAGRGLGFGLPKCWAIMKQHNGEIEIESKPGQGTTVTLRFP